MLAKLALHIERLPRVDEELTLLTQPENCKRAVNKRITHFYDASGAEAAVMDSRWVLIDTEKRIILRKHPEQFNDQWAADVPFELPIKLPRIAPEDCEVLGEQQAVYSRCDMNGHLNNTRYLRLATTVRSPAGNASPCAAPDRQRTPSILKANGKENLPLRHS